MIAEDNVLLREGLVRLLSESEIEVVGTSGNADKLLVLVSDDPPDVAIVDIRLPPTHTDEGMRAACRSAPSTPRSVCWSSLNTWRSVWPCSCSAIPPPGPDTSSR
jgi:DNA-binding NarL/FixJ family response regulator